MAPLLLCVVFLVIIVLLAVRRPLYQAVLGGLIATAVLFRMPPADIAGSALRVFTDWGSLSVLLSMYLISLLARLLGARKQIEFAQQDLNGLFHNRRINAAGAPLFIGLLPSAAAMILCSDIVKDATDGYLKPEEQALVTSWFRHIPESTLPTYSGVLLMATLSGVPLNRFIPAMLLPILVLALLGYLPYLRRLPKDPGTPRSENRARDAVNLVRHLWTLLLILILIIAFRVGVVPALAGVIAVALAVYRFRPREILDILKGAFDWKLLLNTFLVLALKEFLAWTGVLELLPGLFSTLPIPTYLIFCLLFFVGGIISGSNGIIAMGTPLAFAALDGGVPLMVLLMCVCHAASQVSPVHVCLVVAADYFHIPLGSLIRRAFPLALGLCAFAIVYYKVLLLL